jgi:hypothetical protein
MLMISLVPPKIDVGAISGSLKAFVEAPNPDQGRWVLVVVMLLFLWLLRRQDNRKQGDLKRGATDVLEDKYKSGEISEETYRKARADLSLRPKSR